MQDFLVFFLGEEMTVESIIIPTEHLLASCGISVFSGKLRNIHVMSSS